MGTLLNRRRYMGGVKGLPYDAEVEWLKSSGTQYIDTLLYGSMDLDYEVIVKPSNAGTQFQNILGDRYSSSSRRYNLMFNNNGLGYAYCGSNNQVQFSGTQNYNNFAIYKKEGLDIFINGAKSGTLSEQEFTTPNTVLLFGMRDNGSMSNPFYGYILSCTLSRNGVLLRDFIPVRVGQTGYMYDKVSGNLFGNLGSGTFEVGNDLQEVEYLESSGTQYIDSGIECTSDLSVDFKVMWPSQVNAAICGGIKNLSSGYFRHHLSPYAQTNNPFYWIQADTADASIKLAQTANTWYNISIDAVNGEAVINDVTKTFTPISTLHTTGRNYGIFARIGGGTMAMQYRASIFAYFKMYRGGVLLRDFIPVRAGQTGYLYDRVSGHLYPNLGTGSFTLGPDKS